MDIGHRTLGESNDALLDAIMDSPENIIREDEEL